MRTILIIAMGLALRGAPVAAQFPPPPFEIGRISEVQASAPTLIRPGVLGGAVGVVVGSVLVGIPLAHALEPTDDGRSTPGIIIGFQIGQALGIPTGVHLGSHGGSKFRRALLISTAIGAMGTVLLWTDDFDALFESRRNQVVLIAVPIAQLIASIRAAQN